MAPGITEMQHPMNFGWFPANACLSSILGDFASSGLSSLGISWESSPSLTEVEEVVTDWLRQLTGLSDQWSGVIQDTASTACLVAMLAARERASDHAQADGGLVRFGRPLHVYTTEEAHSSVRKAALLAGYAARDIRLVDVDPWTRDMRTEHLAELMQADLEAGGAPAIVVASLGSTGVTAFDPLPEIVAGGCAVRRLDPRRRRDGRVPRCCCPNAATSSPGSRTPTRSPGTRTSGWAPSWTPRCSTCATPTT